MSGVTTPAIPTVTITIEEYERLKQGFEAYERIREKNRRAVQANNAKCTPEERSARARKAAEARIAKYGQKHRKTPEDQ